jgi:hypothetical protein
MRIIPVDQEWIHNHLMAPFLQGIELMNFAWKGYNYQSVTQNPLSLKERAISWIQGACLTIPFVNIIIWLAWKVFGSPEQLFEPYDVESKFPPIPEPVEQPKPTAYVRRKRNPSPPVRCVACSITTGKDKKEIDLQIKEKVDSIEINQVEKQKDFDLKMIYNSDWTLATSLLMRKNTTCSFSKRDEKHVTIWMVKEEETTTKTEEAEEKVTTKTFELTEDLPWIQDPIFGLKKFILSDATQLSFHVIIAFDPLVALFEKHSFITSPFAKPKEPPSLLKCTVTKIKTEANTITVQLIPDEAPYNWGVGILQYDKETGILKEASVDLNARCLPETNFVKASIKPKLFIPHTQKSDQDDQSHEAKHPEFLPHSQNAQRRGSQ